MLYQLATSKTTDSIAHVFEHQMLPYLPRCPVKLLSDNGKEFVGSHFRNMLERYNITHVLTTPNHPASNGLVERVNRTLLELLRIQAEQVETWLEVLPRTIMIYNSTYHAALSCSPSEFIFHNQHQTAGVSPVTAEAVGLWKEGHPSFVSFKVGQRVLKKTVLKGFETSGKFKERFHGPYLVNKVNANGVTYELINEKNNHMFRANHAHLKRYLFPPFYIKNHNYFKTIENDIYAPEDGNTSEVPGHQNDYDFCPPMLCSSGSEDFSFSGFDSDDESSESYSFEGFEHSDSSAKSERSVKNFSHGAGSHAYIYDDSVHAINDDFIIDDPSLANINDFSVDSYHGDRPEFDSLVSANSNIFPSLQCQVDESVQQVDENPADELQVPVTYPLAATAGSIIPSCVFIEDDIW